MSELPDTTETDELEVNDALDEEVTYDLVLREAPVAHTERAADAAERIAIALEQLGGSRNPPPPQPRIPVPPPARRSR